MLFTEHCGHDAGIIFVLDREPKSEEAVSSGEQELWPPVQKVLGTKRRSSHEQKWTESINPMDAPLWKISALHQLKELASLGDNWDGYGSPPINDETRLSVARLLASIKILKLPTPTIAPESGGGVQIEWQIGNRGIELHVSPTQTCSYLLEIPQHDVRREGILGLTDLAQIEALVANLL